MREFSTVPVAWTVTEQFAQIVEHHGARTALMDGAVRLTYAELDRAANQVAWAVAQALATQPADDKSPVVIYLGHGISQIVAILGVLKAGRAYCALDPTFPPERSAMVLEALHCRLVVTDGEHQGRARQLAQGQRAILDLTAAEPGAPDAFQPPPVAPDDIAAIFFTSGSTGKPKGIIRTHHNLVGQAFARAADEPCQADDVVSMLYSCSFSASSSDLYVALLTGAALCLYDLRRDGPAGLAHWIEEHGITRLHLHAPVLRLWLDDLPATAIFPSLRYVRPSDRLYAADVERLWRHLPLEAVIAHSLGSTESGVIASHLMRRGQMPAGAIVPVGRLLRGVELRLLDAEGNPAPPGEAGEMVVSAPMSTPGYWDDPELTAAKFFDDPTTGRRFYRQGDLARWRPDGLLELAGRKDFQVKIRGYRVELGEVEAALEQLPAVHQALVVADIDAVGEKRLVAYLAPTTPATFSLAAAHRALAERLPAYMVPARYVVMDRLPLMTNGKVDRAALPSPTTAQPAIDTPYAPPRTPLEREVAAIWAEVLGLATVGIHDNFLDLGGHSLLATQIASRIGSRLPVDLPVSALFEAATVAELTIAVTTAALAAGAAEGSDAAATHYLERASLL